MRAAGSANGPTRRTDWDTINWRKAQRIVRNLRQRIFRATQASAWRKVRSLQKLMLRSYANIVLSVRQVTQVNAGKYTPGVDRLVVKTPAARGQLVDRLATFQPWKAKPVRRVYIPKSNGNFRPLGIPAVIDRCLQAQVKNALEPSWEARFEGSSYGFRPGRGCHDAIAKIYHLARSNGRKRWAVDADIKGAFDNLDQDFLLRTIGEVPARELIKQWLKAGVLEDGVVHETPLGVPQGGVISPLLLNLALHGLEAALGITHDCRGKLTGKRAVVRYADNLVVFCESREDAEQVAEQILPAWLSQRGLSLSAEKTRIVQLTEGFDFLGFHVRQYPAPQTTRTGYKLLIKPSKKSVTGLRKKLRGIWLEAAHQPLGMLLQRLNPLIRGWANYFRTAVASKTFQKLDRWMFRRTVRYVKRRHPHKPKVWCIQRYWGRLNPKVKDPWVFGDKATGHYLLKFGWFPIERHVLVRSTASPDDPSLREYWWARRKVNIRQLHPSDVKLAEVQDWVCPLCGMFLINREVLERHHLKPKREGGTDAPGNRVLVHLYCHQQLTADQRRHRG